MDWGGRTDFAPFARGTNLWDLRQDVIDEGGLLGKNEQGPAHLPLVLHPDEAAVDAFINRAKIAYNAWDGTLTHRGPFDGGQLNQNQITRLAARRSYGKHWSFHPSDTGGFALHRRGAITFIYHVQ